MAIQYQEAPETHEVTQVLHDLRDHPELFNDRLFPLLYTAMKRIAQRQMRGERAGGTLQATALVNEAYMRLVKSKPDWQNRAHFLACASNAMRRILIDYARKRGAARRGAELEHVVLDEIAAPKSVTPKYLLALDAALLRLDEVDPVKARIVHLKFFGGLTMDEIAQVMKMGLTSVKQHYRLARAMLRRELSE